MPRNFMRHYYDVYCLLQDERVQAFIGTPAYEAHKLVRFPKADLAVPLAENEAFKLSDPDIRAQFERSYASTAALYYQSQPPFAELVTALQAVIHTL